MPGHPDSHLQVRLPAAHAWRRWAGSPAVNRTVWPVASETTTLGPSPEPVGGTSFLFHNLILMRYIEENSETGRALNIVKMRNSRHSRDLQQFDIDEHGVTVGPTLQEITGTLGWSVLRASPQSDKR